MQGSKVMHSGEPAVLVLDTVLDWYWNPEQVYEGDEPLRIVVPGDRMTGMELRPEVRFAKALRINGTAQDRGHMRLRMWQMKKASYAPPEERGEYRDMVTVDGLFSSVSIKSLTNGWCHGVRAYFSLVELIGGKLVTDGKQAYCLSVMRVDDE